MAQEAVRSGRCSIKLACLAFRISPTCYRYQIDQAMNLGDHSIPGSYIPFSWATLRRWQQTQEANGTVVTDREYNLVEAALSTMRLKVQDKRKQVVDTLGYHKHDPEYLQTVSELSGESGKLADSLQRLKALRFRRLKPADVYGSAAQSPDLQAALLRWKDQRENNLQVQIAMIPQQDDGYLMFASRSGAPKPFDIDSML